MANGGPFGLKGTGRRKVPERNTRVVVCRDLERTGAGPLMMTRLTRPGSGTMSESSMTTGGSQGSSRPGEIRFPRGAPTPGLPDRASWSRRLPVRLAPSPRADPGMGQPRDDPGPFGVYVTPDGGPARALRSGSIEPLPVLHAHPRLAQQARGPPVPLGTARESAPFTLADSGTPRHAAPVTRAPVVSPRRFAPVSVRELGGGSASRDSARAPQRARATALGCAVGSAALTAASEEARQVPFRQGGCFAFSRSRRPIAT